MKTFSYLFKAVRGIRADRAMAHGSRIERFQIQRSVTIEGTCLVQFPESYAEDDAWPTLIYLHGAGERAYDEALLREHGPLAHRTVAEMPFIVIVPQCVPGEWWIPWKLQALLGYCLSAFSIDRSRIYGTGISMGGTGLWAWAAECPDVFAAIAPICGRADPLHAPHLAGTPTWVIHGGADEVITASQSREMVRAIEASGGRPKLTIVPGVGHPVWMPFYRKKALYQWFLLHTNASLATS